MGGPDTVVRRLEEAHQRLGFGNLVCVFQFGGMPAEQARRNIDRITQHVIPRLRELDAAAVGVA